MEMENLVHGSKHVIVLIERFTPGLYEDFIIGVEILTRT